MELFGTTHNPVPPGAVVSALTARDGLALRTARWEASAGSRNGTVCLFGGRTEYIEKYFETIADLRRRGFAVVMMDWRGQGGSGRKLKNPLKGHVDDFAEFDADLEQFMTEIVLPDCPPPYFALAHSMGANVILRAACRRDCWFDRIVLLAPMLQLARLPMPVPLIEILAGAAVFLGLGDLWLRDLRTDGGIENRFDGNILTSDKRRFERNREVLVRTPQLALRGPTVAWIRAAFAAMKAVNDFGFPSQVHVPALLLAAGQDRVVSSRAVEVLASQLRAGSHITIAGARHELLQERDGIREQVWAAFDAFVPGGRSG